MNKPLLGLLLGTVLGLLDGASAWFDAQSDPVVRRDLMFIIMGSTFKGLLVGLATGFVARQTNSLTIAVVFGLVLGGILAYVVAAMQDAYYLRITLPGAILGAIVGFAAQKYGTGGKARTAPSV